MQSCYNNFVIKINKFVINSSRGIIRLDKTQKFQEVIMKERMRNILCCIGTVGLMMTVGAVPAMADTLDDASYNWDDKAAANVVTYANIRESADADSSCVGRLPSGAVATVVGAENGWVQICSGEVEGYIREDLLLYQEDAKDLYEALHGAGNVTAEAVTQEEVQEEEPALIETATEETTTATEETTSASSSVSNSDLDLMAAIIECEAGGESYEGKIGVGAVILNRMRSSEFPNTLSEVIYQSGQFEPVWTGKLSSVLSRGANADCYSAARDVFAGANTIGECLFFHAGGGSGLTIGNQTFY